MAATGTSVVTMVKQLPIMTSHQPRMEHRVEQQQQQLPRQQQTSQHAQPQQSTRQQQQPVKFWEDFVLFGMPGRDLVMYWTGCSNDQYWDMNVFLMTQLLTTINCCGRSVWAFSRVTDSHQHIAGCGWAGIMFTVQQNLLLAFPWMNAKRASGFWLSKIMPDYVRAQARCLEKKWPDIDHLLDPARKETLLRLSYGGPAQKPVFTAHVSMLELVRGDAPTVNPDGTLKLQHIDMATIIGRLPAGATGVLHHVDPFWNLTAVHSDEEIRTVVQAEYDGGHDAFYFHLVPES